MIVHAALLALGLAAVAAKPTCCWSKCCDSRTCGDFDGSGAQCDTNHTKTCNSDSDCLVALVPPSPSSPGPPTPPPPSPPTPPPPEPYEVRLGAIRWDNWAGSGHDKTADATVACMSPKEWHSRVPFCGKVINDAAVDFDCDTPAVMEQELALAERAGVNYWAFVQYPLDDYLSSAITNYLATEPRSIKFSIIMDGNTLPEGVAISGASWDAFVDRYNGYFARSDFETTESGECLVFWFMQESQVTSTFGSIAKFKAFCDAWSMASVKKLHFVLMDGYEDEFAREVGMASRSSYALGDGLVNGTFQKQRDQSMWRWNHWASLGSDVLPLAALGWDPRPRMTGCAPWGDEGKSWTQTPTTDEVVGAIQDAIEWACSNRATSKTRHVLAYAWNENSEGGWLVPTLGEGDARIKALEIARAGRPWSCTKTWTMLV